MSIKIISLNIEKNKHYDKIIPFLLQENADIVCLQEVLEEDFEMIKNSIHMNGFYKTFQYEANGLDWYKEQEGKKQGTAIFSKMIGEYGYSFYLGKEEYTNCSFLEYKEKKNELESALFLWSKIVDSDGKPYTVVTTHYPVTKNGDSTPHQLGILKPLFERLDELGEFVLCGDFNAPRGKETFARIAKKYKDNIPDTYVTSIDQNLHRVKNLERMVDGVFTTPTYTATDVVLIDGLSDHMAILANIHS